MVLWVISYASLASNARVLDCSGLTHPPQTHPYPGVHCYGRGIHSFVHASMADSHGWLRITQDRSRLLTELREALFVSPDAHLEILEAGQRGEIPHRIVAAAAARCEHAFQTCICATLK